MEPFRGRGGWLVRRKLYDHCTLTALARLCGNLSKAAYRRAGPTRWTGPFPATGLVGGRKIERLSVQQTLTLWKTLRCLLNGITKSRLRQHRQRFFHSAIAIAARRPVPSAVGQSGQPGTIVDALACRHAGRQVFRNPGGAQTGRTGASCTARRPARKRMRSSSDWGCRTPPG